MATLTIRDLDDDLKAALRVRAAEHGISMEAEVKAILRDVLSGTREDVGVGTRIRRRFDGVDVGDLDLPARTDAPGAANLP